MSGVEIRPAGNHAELLACIDLQMEVFGGPNGKHGRGTDKVSAFVAISTADDGKPLYAKVEVTERVNKETALDFATRMVSKGSTITTDGLSVYPQLKEHGYVHERVLSSHAEVILRLYFIGRGRAMILGLCLGLCRYIFLT